jgi:hypothetical protein
MPAQYTWPTDNRAVGTGDPPNDVNALIREANAFGALYNVLDAAYAGGADPGTPSTPGADSTAAFAACLAATTAANAEMVIPPGNYTVNTAGLNLTGPLVIRGLGSATVTGGALVPAVRLNCNGNAGAGALFNFPYQGFLWGGLKIANVVINYTGTGDVFHLININVALFQDVAINLSASASYAFRTTGSVSVLNCEFERVFITTTNAVRSSPMISLSSVTSGSISNNTWWKCTFSNNGLDNTQYMIYIDCAGGSGAYHYMETFRDCWFEHPFGGAIKSLSGLGLTIDGCTVWDIFSGQGTTVGASTYYIGAFPSTGPGSQQSRINGCSRNRNGPDGSTTWDIFCEATTSGTIVEGFSVKPDTPSTTTNAFFNFSSHPDIQVIGCVCPQGAAVNGNSTTVISSPGWSCTVIGAGASANVLDVVQAPYWTPLDSGYLAWNFDPAVEIGGGTLMGTTGQVQLLRINVRRGITVTNVAVFLTALGVTLTSGQNFLALYGSAGGAAIGVTADQTTNWNSGGTNRFVPAALVGGPYALAAGFYWVGILSNWSGTAPSFGRAQTLNATLMNLGTAVSAARVGHYAAPNTTMPSITPASIVLDSNYFWVGLS